MGFIPSARAEPGHRVREVMEKALVTVRGCSILLDVSNTEKDWIEMVDVALDPFTCLSVLSCTDFACNRSDGILQFPSVWVS